MPRRPRKQPKPKGFQKASNLSYKNDSKIARWDKLADIELDEEDQFHQTRDRILLEGDTHDNDEDLDNGEEEVFGLGLITDSSSTSDEEEFSGDNEGSLKKNVTPTSKSKKKKINKRAPSTSPSESEPEQETWGRKKSAYYASNSEFLVQTRGEENEDEFNDMEEKEARKIQSRMKSLVLEEDYGLDDVQGSEPDLFEEIDITSALSVSAPVEPMDKTAAWRYLERTSPESLALSREWCDLLEDLKQAGDQLKNGVTLNADDDTIISGFKHLHHHTLLSYITILAYYIHLRASEGVASHSSNIPSARTKAVLGRLLTLKQALSIMEDLDFDVNDQEWSELSDLSADGSEGEPVLNTSKGKKRTVVPEDELYALLKEADEIAAQQSISMKRSVFSDGSVEDRIKPKKKQVTSQGQKSIIFDLVEPSFKPSRPLKRSGRNGSPIDGHGEITQLLEVDSIDKKSRRHTLRFHTHKIETSTRKREQHREKLGGDDDLPYLERKKEKESRIQKEVLKTRGQGGDDLEAGSDNKNSVIKVPKRKRDESSDSEAEDGYYELVKRVKQERKEGKKREYEQSRLMGRFSEEDGTEGPRTLTRAILKNRGLTPRRSKSVRNPRVKKRERYEKAQKKVKSQKAVYRKGMSGRPYSGEESGISKVVKSVKLS